MTMTFDGDTYLPELDETRLTTQLVSVRDLMVDGKWRTLPMIASTVEASEASVSARLRDLRKPRFGAWIVERRRVTVGINEYRVAIPNKDGQAMLFEAAN